ncbi:UNKNOWN [Stylonychia lemnae]|uniref:Uncharacterized protein n=1 Tax=Stylonychia lemnae TaxID=5949 RepID=A0A078A9Q9_STYLE|nr:UNKNOWN [Stylonychia lemnae]|eukprot:CDW78914.1 UNKNOWN [Stylonychia lemnae]
MSNANNSGKNNQRKNSKSPIKNGKTPTSRERVSKMREIKGEISDLMSKIENASKQIYESFIHKKHESLLSSQNQQQRQSSLNNTNQKSQEQPTSQKQQQQHQNQNSVNKNPSFQNTFNNQQLASQLNSDQQSTLQYNQQQQFYQVQQMLLNRNKENQHNIGQNYSPGKPSPYDYIDTLRNSQGNTNTIQTNDKNTLQQRESFYNQHNLQNNYSFNKNFMLNQQSAETLSGGAIDPNQLSITKNNYTNHHNMSNQTNYEKLLSDYLSLKRTSEDQQLIMRDLSIQAQSKQDEIQNLIYERQEMRLKYELDIDYLTLQNKHLQQRVMHFQEQSQFSDILLVYNEQMLQLENQNKSFLVELRKLAKVQANEIKSSTTQIESQKLEFMEKNIRTLKQTIKKLTSEIGKQQTQLEEYRKKDRMFNLQKRCVDDSIKKANLYFRKFNQVQESAQTLSRTKNDLSQDVKYLQDQNKQLEFHVLDLAHQVDMLQEENQLLKDFTYNVDQSAKLLHQQKFMNENKTQELSLIEKINSYAQRSSVIIPNRLLL